jgi:hypothetical protein
MHGSDSCVSVRLQETNKEEASKKEEGKPKEEEQKPKEEEKPKDGEEKKEEAPPPEELEMRVYMHCEGCARKVKKILNRLDGTSCMPPLISASKSRLFLLLQQR